MNRFAFSILCGGLLLIGDAALADPQAVKNASLAELQAALEEQSSINELKAKGVTIDGIIYRDDIPAGLMAAKFSTLHGAVRDQEKLIYGVDNRLPIREVADTDVLANAGAAVALVKRIQMGKQDDGSWKLNAKTFKERFGVCDSEPFGSLPAAAFCSGFLVDSDTIVTAGHCVQSAADLSSMYFVFGFRSVDETNARMTFGENDVYKGLRLVARKIEGQGADWAVVKLARKVVGHAPIKKFRTNGKIDRDKPVYVIGHPVGLPLIYAGGAIVRDNESDDYFVSNLDTYGGNSGSMVVNADTHAVEGILVRGETDFVTSDAGCKVSNVCPDTGCRGEDVTRMTVLKDKLPKSVASR